MDPLSTERQELINKELVDAIVLKLENLKTREADSIVCLSFEKLHKILTKEEQAFVKQLLSLDPKIYGFTGQFSGIDKVPTDLVPIKRQKYMWEGEKKQIPAQYLPERVFDACKKMNKAMQKDLERRVLIKSGYRSPAYQVFVIVYNLTKKDYKLEEVLRWVALPGYSEHGNPERQAIDFITEDGIINGPKINFSQTPEYDWLQENAEKFNFYLSYPENNKLGIAFEPWHWRYEG